jgi:hypothetical protein
MEKDAAGTSLDGTADSARRVCSGKKTLAHTLYDQLERPLHMFGLSQHGLFTLD